MPAMFVIVIAHSSSTHSPSPSASSSSSTAATSVCGGNVNVIIIIRPIGLVLFHLLCLCRRHRLCCEAPPPPPTMSVQGPFSPPHPQHSANAPPPRSSSAVRKSKENAVRKSNPQFLSPNDPEKAKLKVVNGIVSSPDNPATVRRLSQEDSSSHTVSWHKRVVVHRVPRSDASRSMFVSSSQSKEGLSSQCCVIV